MKTWSAFWLSSVEGTDGYPLLLVTPLPLQSLVRAKDPEHRVVATYHRDSLWLTGHELVVAFPVMGLDEAKHELTLRTQFEEETFRYEPAAPADVKRLADNPLGTIPISRMGSPDHPSHAVDLAFLQSLNFT